MAETFDYLFEGNDGLGGFEQMDATTVAIPFIRVLQSQSPACQKNTPDYIDGAEAGVFFNAASKEVYTSPLEVVVGKFEHYFTEWRPERGGYAGAHSPENIELLLQRGDVHKGDVAQLYFPDTGNILTDTYAYYIVMPQRLGAGVCIMSLTSTQLKEARRWNRMLTTTFYPGTTRRALPYHMRWSVSTTRQQNTKGSWFGLQVDFAGFVTQEQLSLVQEERKAVVALEGSKELQHALDAGFAEGQEDTTMAGSDVELPF